LCVQTFPHYCRRHWALDFVFFILRLGILVEIKIRHTHCTASYWEVSMPMVDAQLRALFEMQDKVHHRPRLHRVPERPEAVRPTFSHFLIVDKRLSLSLPPSPSLWSCSRAQRRCCYLKESIICSFERTHFVQIPVVHGSDTGSA
jgi:hypothetical protein